MRTIDPGRQWKSARIEINTERIDSWLSDAELELMKTIPHPGRRDEWARVRIVAKRLAIDEGLCTEPRSCSIASKGKAPVVEIEGRPVVRHASLTHSGRVYGATISTHPNGLDVQVLRRIDRRALKFFLDASEIEDLRRHVEMQASLMYWVAKEASFKCDPAAGTYKDVVMRALDLDAHSADFVFDSPSGSGTIELETVAGEDFMVGLAIGEWG